MQINGYTTNTFNHSTTINQKLIDILTDANLNTPANQQRISELIESQSSDHLALILDILSRESLLDQETFECIMLRNEDLTNLAQAFTTLYDDFMLTSDTRTWILECFGPVLSPYLLADAITKLHRAKILSPETQQAMFLSEHPNTLAEAFILLHKEGIPVTSKIVKTLELDPNPVGFVNDLIELNRIPILDSSAIEQILPRLTQYPVAQRPHLSKVLTFLYQAGIHRSLEINIKLLRNTRPDELAQAFISLQQKKIPLSSEIIAILGRSMRPLGWATLLTELNQYGALSPEIIQAFSLYNGDQDSEELVEAYAMLFQDKIPLSSEIIISLLYSEDPIDLARDMVELNRIPVRHPEKIRLLAQDDWWEPRLVNAFISLNQAGIHLSPEITLALFLTQRFGALAKAFFHLHRAGIPLSLEIRSDLDQASEPAQVAKNWIDLNQARILTPENQKFVVDCPTFYLHPVTEMLTKHTMLTQPNFEKVKDSTDLFELSRQMRDLEAADNLNQASFDRLIKSQMTRRN
jgi:hypothetical protein